MILMHCVISDFIVSLGSFLIHLCMAQGYKVREENFIYSGGLGFFRTTLQERKGWGENNCFFFFPFLIINVK